MLYCHKFESQGDFEPEQGVTQPEPDDELDGLDRFYAMGKEGCPTTPDSDEPAPGRRGRTPWSSRASGNLRAEAWLGGLWALWLQ